MPIDLWYCATYNVTIEIKEEQKMAKKSVTPSIRMNEDQYLKLKALKEQYGISWNELIKHVNKLLEKDIIKNGNKTDSSTIQKDNY